MRNRSQRKVQSRHDSLLDFVRDANSVPSTQVAWHVYGQSYISWLSSILSTTVQPKVTPNSPALCLKRDLENLIPVEQIHAARDESKVVAATRNSELSDQHA
jgi:hypothetical protein